jgi:hypothetical protein
MFCGDSLEKYAKSDKVNLWKIVSQENCGCATFLISFQFDRNIYTGARHVEFCKEKTQT